MRFIDINLANDPVRNYAPLYWTYGILSGIVLVFLTYNVFSFTRYGGELERLKQEHKQSAFLLNAIQEKNRRHSKEIANWDLATMTLEANFASNAILRRTFSWTELFNQLEEVVPAQIKLAAIRPNISAEGITIRIDGIAKGPPAILELLERLQASPHFRNVYPGTERRDDGGMMTFFLTFTYIPPEPEVETAPVERAALDADTVESAGAAAAGNPAAEPARSDRQDRSASADPGTGAATGPAPEQAPPGETGGAAAGDGTAPGDLPATAEPDASGSPGEETERVEVPPEAVGTEDEPEPDPDRPTLSLPGEMRKKAKGTRPPAGRGARPGPPTRSAATPATDGPVEFLLQGETVSEIYRRLARIGKVSIVLEEGLNPGKRITARVQGDTFEAALQAVADKAGHVLVKEGEGIYRVADATNPPPSMRPDPVEESDLAGDDPGLSPDARPGEGGSP